MKWFGKGSLAPLVMIISLSSWSLCRAKTINAATCQFSDVSSAVAQASAGDIVQLPAGTAVWSQTLTLNGVSLLGAGTNATILTDEENRNTSGQMVTLNAVAGTLSEISNIQFCGGVTNTSENFYGTIAAYGTLGSSWRIDHNFFNGLYAKNIATYGNSFSVIDHNAFFEKGISIEDNGYVPNDGMGDQSWNLPPTYGLNSSNALYVENNYFTNLEPYVASLGACDGEGGARMVFRYNTVWNDCFNNHGTESGGRLRSERSFEIYGNTFNGGSLSPLFAAMLVRGGSGVIFSNTASGYNEMVALRNYRYTCSYSSTWAPFAGANGLSPFDSNNPTLFLSGTNSAPNGSSYLQVAGANWTPNQWYGYTVIDTTSGLFSEIVSNTANTIYYIGSTPASASIVACTALTFNLGDPFQIRQVYVAMDQPGRGSGDLLQDANGGQLLNGILVTIDTATGIESWPRQALDGVYCWGNTLNGAHSEETSMYPGVLQGRDFYNDTSKPGYMPFVYPHPLDVSTNTSNGGGGNTNINSNTNIQPPSNLRIIPGP